MTLGRILAAALAAPDAAPCELHSAERVATRTVSSAPEHWLDRCVALEGYVDGRIFYEDVAGYYRRHANDYEDRLNDGWLGLYFPSTGHPTGGLRRGTVVGRLSSCERDYEQAVAEAAPDAIVMMTGYCHHHGGLVLTGASFQDAGAASFERQTGEAARSAFGDLDPIEPTPQLKQLASGFLAALLAGDPAKLRSLVGPWDFNEPETEEAIGAFDALLGGGAGSPLREIKAVQRPQVAYFKSRSSRADRELPDLPTWLVCFCRGEDCTRSWPVAEFDGRVGEALPYVCLRIDHRDADRSQPLSLSVATRNYGLTEPRAHR
jgi:hypothetical protein